MKQYDRVYQFKVTLKGSKPSIWRRIQVPETYTLWDLHVAIQDAMGWCDCHLHQFEFGPWGNRNNPLVGIPDEEELSDRKVLAGWKQRVNKWFSLEKPTADYEYDFGDGWRHEVKLEKILPREGSAFYPKCTAGKRACPPEDSGGIFGYEEFIRIINDPADAQHEEMLEWVGGEYDPERFDPDTVEFDDPDERLKTALECF